MTELHLKEQRNIYLPYMDLLDRCFAENQGASDGATESPRSTRTKEMLAEYMAGVLFWNEKINLTAIKEPEEFVLKHYADSLALLSCPEYQGAKRIIDMGTGGGFPGIPLAIASPNKAFTLADSLNKRLRVIDSLAAEIGINNISTLHGRAEDIGRIEGERESYDLCTSRAVADMAVLAELTLPLVKVGGYLAAYKSMDIDKELDGAAKAIKTLGGRLARVQQTLEGHSIVFIEKVSETPSKYPRKAGAPSKTPIR